MGERANKVEAAKAALIKKATEVRSKALAAEAQAEQVRSHKEQQKRRRREGAAA